MSLNNVPECLGSFGEGSSCGPSDLKGSWAISPSPGIDFLSACLSKCVACASCRYVSVSRKDNDCSWYRSCDLATSLPASSDYNLEHHSYQVRHENGTTVERVRSRLNEGAPLAPTLESEGIRVESFSHDAVCFGSTCMSWAAAHAVCSGPGGWKSGMPPPLSACTWPHGGGCEPSESCGTCSDYKAQPWSAFNRSLAWPPSKLARLQSSRPAC